MVKKILVLIGLVGLMLFVPKVTRADVTPPISAGASGAVGAPNTPSDIHTTSPYCNGTSGINTALGCIPTSQTGFFDAFFRLGIGIAGGISFLLILYGGLKMMLSAGNPEALNEGRELVTSAIFGLLLIIFSVFILKLIGVNILGLPGFS